MSEIIQSDSEGFSTNTVKPQIIPTDAQLIRPTGGSKCWQVFRTVASYNNFVWCIICKKWITGSKTNMKNMNSHINSIHPNYSSTSLITLSNENKQALDKLLVKMIIDCNMSLNTVDRLTFRQFADKMSEFGSYIYNMPHRSSFVNMIDTAYDCCLQEV